MIAWPTTGLDVANAMKWPTDRATELEDYALVAVSKIEDKVGPWHGQALTHTFYAAEPFRAMQLPWPIADLPSLTRDGASVTDTIDAVELDTGVLYGTFPSGNYIVTAAARTGASCPPEVKLAARKLAVHLAKQELVGPRQAGFTGGPDKDTDVLQGFALPRAVSELIADHIPPGGFA